MPYPLHSNTNSRGRQPQIRSTTILAVRRDGKVVIAGDGQVTMGDTIMKSGARKVRRLYGDKVLAGFAGASADAFALFQRFETKLEQFHGQLNRAAVELAKDWRTDKMMRNLEALLLVSDPTSTLVIGGNGDVIEPDEAVVILQPFRRQSPPQQYAPPPKPPPRPEVAPHSLSERAPRR